MIEIISESAMPLRNNRCLNPSRDLYELLALYVRPCRSSDGRAKSSCMSVKSSYHVLPTSSLHSCGNLTLVLCKILRRQYKYDVL